MTTPTEAERNLARHILQRAVDDLRIESLRVGRIDLFEALYPALIDPSMSVSEIDGGTYSSSEIRLALVRLRERLRERVNARLREEEPDPDRRRALRRRLQSTPDQPGETP